MFFRICTLNTGTGCPFPKNSAPSADPVDLPDIHLPTDEWKRIQYAEFAQLREQITQLRPQFARRAGAGGAANAALPDIDDQQAWRVFMHANRPLLSTMLRLDQPSLEQVLDYQLEWLLQGDSDAGVDDADDADDEDDAVNTAATMSPTWDLAGLAALGRWIYSLLGCLHTPLEPDVHSTLRAIAKTALGIRNGLADDESGAEMAAPLNLLVCIIAANFGQADLANRV